MEQKNQSLGDGSINIGTPDGKSFVVDMSKVAPANNPNCVHRFVDDPTDQTEYMIAQVCVNPGCSLGRMIRKP